ncbi:helix-turn-helix transcriptional regulator [Eggerthellaceae bacterium zg-1084]|uniref:Helix-turn-helix transcriptional regulator n=1 Tax=Berryella wangjianweii TaxID=2734634 RepID=A0A6M8J4V3_9ACTN|nr:helix-turn-helix transcriptional regulator [Berryella wangjianweii]NPD31182.1 helix-turn-helix transcriptional regulator [Berryella wangjianweii]QKF06738.1 helix-turn-helix transcriptional regulator [Berryella wangjianweii]
MTNTKQHASALAAPSAPQGGWGSYAVAAAALALTGCASWALNVGVYPEMASYAPWLREFRTIAVVAAYALFALAAWAKPSFLSRNTLIVAALGSTVSGDAIMLSAVPAHDVAYSILGASFSTVGSAAASIAAITMMARLGDKRRALLALIAAMALTSLVTSALPLPDTRMAVVWQSLCTLGAFGMTLPFVGPTFDALARSESARVIEAANPRSFLFPFHRVFLCVLLFSVIHGFALAFGSKQGVPAYSAVTGLLLLTLGIVLFAVRPKAPEDRVFDFAVLFVGVGLVASLVSASLPEGLPHVLLFAGSEAFRTLMIIVVCAIGAHNIYALIPALALMKIHQNVGVVAGATIGHTTNAVGPELLVAVMLAAFLCAFWLMYRGFSFTATVEGILAIADPTASGRRDARSDGGEPRGRDAGEDHPEAASPLDAKPLQHRCALLGQQARLTPREQEVFEMLAEGRNARYITERHTVSLNTVKSHIKHVYQKLDVHSQQELIDLVRLSAPDAER